MSNKRSEMQKNKSERTLDSDRSESIGSKSGGHDSSLWRHGKNKTEQNTVIIFILNSSTTPPKK